MLLQRADPISTPLKVILGRENIFTNKLVLLRDVFHRGMLSKLKLTTHRFVRWDVKKSSCSTTIQAVTPLWNVSVCVCVSLYILRPFIAAKQLSGNDLKNSAELAHLPFAVLLFLLFFYLSVNFYKGTSFGSFFSPYLQVSL